MINNKMTTLEEKIKYKTTIASLWYDISGHNISFLNRQGKKYDLKTSAYILENLCGGISGENPPRHCFERNWKVDKHKNNTTGNIIQFALYVMFQGRL